MSKISVSGSPTGTATFDIVAPATNTNRTITLPDSSGQVSVLDLRAAIATTSGTSHDFLNIPATARRITVMFNGVSTNGTSNFLIQIGSGSFTTSGYTSSASWAGAGVTSSAGFIISNAGAANTHSGLPTIILVSGNTWVESGVVRANSAGTDGANAGFVTLSGPLDRIRITTVNGTDTFDAGSVSILVE